MSWGEMSNKLSYRKKSKSIDDALDDIQLLLAGVRRLSQARTRRTLVREARMLLNKIDDQLLESSPLTQTASIEDLAPSEILTSAHYKTLGSASLT